MNCPRCGRLLPDHSRFCQYCGCSLAGVQPPIGSPAPGNDAATVRGAAPPIRRQPAEPPRPAPTRYSVLEENTEKIIQGNLPLMLDKTVLRKGNDGKLSVLCSFRSLSDRPIQAMRVDVKCADVWRESLQPVEGKQYLDLNAGRDTLFGENGSAYFWFERPAYAKRGTFTVKVYAGTALIGQDSVRIT